MCCPINDFSLIEKIPKPQRKIIRCGFGLYIKFNQFYSSIISSFNRVSFLIPDAMNSEKILNTNCSNSRNNLPTVSGELFQG